MTRTLRNPLSAGGSLAAFALTLIVALPAVATAAFSDQSAGPDDEPAPIEVEGCGEWEEDVFTVENAAALSKWIFAPVGVDVSAEKQAARDEFLAEFFLLALQAAAAAGVEPPDCPTEDCTAAEGIGCQAGMAITKNEDYTENLQIVHRNLFGLIPLRFCVITWTFEVSVTVDTGCSECLVDLENIG